MMTTFRVGAMFCPYLSVGLVLRMRCSFDASNVLLDAQDTLELGQVPYLELRRLDVPGQGARVPVDPGHGHAHALGARDVDIRAVADEERLAGGKTKAPQRQLEDDGLGLAPPDFVGDHHRLEEIGHAFTLEDVPRRGRVIRS